jgi:hypothetical protein
MFGKSYFGDSFSKKRDTKIKTLKNQFLQRLKYKKSSVWKIK